MTRVRNTIDCIFSKKIPGSEKLEKIWNMDPPSYALGALSLNRIDRIRLIDFEKPAADAVFQTLTEMYIQDGQTAPATGKYHGSVEFKLKGSPFDCQGLKSAESHLMVCNVLQALTHNFGYTIVSTIKVCDKVTSKSSFLMRKSSDLQSDKPNDKVQLNVNTDCRVKYACISFSEKDKLRLMNFSTETTDRVINIVSTYYDPGMEIKIR